MATKLTTNLRMLRRVKVYTHPTYASIQSKEQLPFREGNRLWLETETQNLAFMASKFTTNLRILRRVRIYTHPTYNSIQSNERLGQADCCQRQNGHYLHLNPTPIRHSGTQFSRLSLWYKYQMFYTYPQCENQPSASSLVTENTASSNKP